jgi:peptidoglycan hydrolase FlgJ
MATPITSTMSSAGDIYTDINSLANIKNVKDPKQALGKVAAQFESLFVGMMLKSMRQANAAFAENGLFDSKDSLFYRDMHDQQLAIELSKGKGIGIASVLERQLAPKVIKKTTPKEDVTKNIKEDIDVAGALPPLNKQEHWRRVISTVSAPGVATARVKSKESEVDFKEPMLHSDWLDPYLATPVIPTEKPVEVKINLTLSSPQDFIDQLLPYARMAARELGVNPLVLIAQSAMETGWGKRMVSDAQGNSSNNFFNIKANSAWDGDAVEVSTLEYSKGIPRREVAQFRQYSSVAESFQDYVKLLQNSPRYQAAVETAQDAKEFLRELHGAGYATDPLYSQKIISLFEMIADGRYRNEK